MLMAISNKFGWLVLTTGNKSEMAMGDQRMKVEFWNPVDTNIKKDDVIQILSGKIREFRGGKLIKAGHYIINGDDNQAKMLKKKNTNILSLQ